MTVNELIERLQALVEDGEATGQTEVLFAHQPHYPLQCGVGGPVVVDEDAEDISMMESHLEFPIGEYFEDEAERASASETLKHMKLAKRPPLVYLHEVSLGSGESPYAPLSAFGD